MAQELFTRKELAEIFGVKPRTIWHWEAKNWIKPCGYIHTRPRYDLDSIKKLGEEISKLKGKKHAKSL